MQKMFPTSRLEAFSDGVIAVIITIMVLELKVPAENGLAGLRSILPMLMVYALSFAFIGVYWINHHQLIERLEHATNTILWVNLIWLFTASLVPFFTAYVVDKHDDSLSVMVYSGCMFASALTFLPLRYAIDCQNHRIGRITRLEMAVQVKHWISLSFYAAAIVIAYWLPHVALLCTAAVTLFWIVPAFGLHGDTNEAQPTGR